MRTRVSKQAQPASSFPLRSVGVLQRKQGSLLREAGVVPPVVHDVLRSTGQPLEASARAFMEPRFAHDFSRVPNGQAPRAAGKLSLVPPHHGSEAEADEVARRVAHQTDAAPRADDSGQDFSRVRVHADAKAAESAQAVNARAYTVGENIVFGQNEYAPETQEGRHLLAHELAHTVQQRDGAGGATVQRAVIDDVREKMSYAFTDWAITDEEALESLALLGTIPPANLAAELAKLDSKYVTRLLDNLPDSAKTGDIYKRIIEAIGPSGAVPYAVEQLNFGFLDWAITDEEVSRVFNIFSTLPAAQQEDFLVKLNDAGRLGRLIDNSNHGHHLLYIIPWLKTLTPGATTLRQRDILRRIVQKSSNDALDTITLATEIRFKVTVGPSTIHGRTPVAWDAPHLRRTYLALDLLPEAHVAGNKELLRFGQFTQDPDKSGGLVEGVYNTPELAINIKTSGDIEASIIHETGHAVDAEMGWRTSAEPALPKRGGWKEYGIGGYNLCAKDMVDDSAGGIKTKLAAGDRADVENDMGNAMNAQSVASLKSDIRAHAWFGALGGADKSAVLNDPALAALDVGLKEPYFTVESGGDHLGNHIYQESYPLQWVRYRHEARSRMVSKYQFRGPGEWFAEAYSFYYQPDKRGRGAKLKDKDPDTKTYFDNFVHTRASTR